MAAKAGWTALFSSSQAKGAARRPRILPDLVPDLSHHGPLIDELSPCGAAGTGRLDVELLDAQPKRLRELGHP